MNEIKLPVQWTYGELTLAEPLAGEVLNEYLFELRPILEENRN